METTTKTVKRRRILSRSKSAINARKEKLKQNKIDKNKKMKQKNKEKMASKKKLYHGKYVPYERAKQIVKVLELSSKAEYLKWYEKYSPDYLPKYPNNAYRNQFEGWIVYLNKTVKKSDKFDSTAFFKDKLKKKEKETKKIKKNIEAIVKHEMNLANNKANRLKRREAIALKQLKKETIKRNKRIEQPVVIDYSSHKGRKPIEKKSNYLSYDEAKALIKDEKFMTINEYTSWWEANKPAGIPKRPDRVYKNSNFKWLDYLSKEFDNKDKYFKEKNYREIYRPYEEAIRFVRTLGLKNASDWQKFYKTGKCPKDIPRYPDIVYQYRKNDPTWGKWYSWEEWLGNSASDLLDAFKEQQRVLIITVPKNVPNGIYTFLYKNGTSTDIDNFIDNNELYVIRIYKIDIFDWMGYLANRYSTYMGSPNTFIISNINNVLFDLDTYMERIL